MPAAIIAALAGDAIGAWVADALIFDIAATTTLDWVTTYAVIQGATSMVSSAAINSALSGGSSNSAGFTASATQRTHIIRSAVANRTVVYGRCMVSGPLVFGDTSADNGTIYLVVPIAGHEIDAVEDVYFNDEAIGPRDGSGNVTTGSYAGYANVRAHYGALDQAADADLIAASANWTAAHRLAGVAYLVITLTWSRDIYPRGIPNVKAVIRGRKLYDPRTGLTAWSDNWALAVRDYLTASYGLACTPAEIDDAYFIAAANIADEDIALSGGGTEKRYTCNGVVDLGATPRSIMEGLLTAGAGFLTWSAGRYRLHAGAYTPPAVTLNEDDLRGPIKVRPRLGRRDLFNAVRGTYVDPTKAWQPCDFPPVSNATYAAQDGGQVIWRDTALPYTTSGATAQRIAKLIMERSRQGITVDFPAKLTAFAVAAMDTIRLDIARLGWSGKEFKVIDWAFAAEGGIDLTLQEEVAASYDWNSGLETTFDAAPDTNLPDPRTVAAPGTPSVVETLYQTTGSAGLKSRATVTWASIDAYAVSQRLAYRPQGGSWVTLPDRHEPIVTFDDLAPGTYEFRAATLNAFGVVSPWSGSRVIDLLGLTAPPSPISGFSVIASNGIAVGTWALSPDLDVRLGGRIVVRWTPLAAGALWENGIDVGEFNGDAVSGLLPMLTGTYLAKARDSTNNWSTTAASFVLTAGNVISLPNSMMVTEHPAFTGVRSGVVVDAGLLELASGATEGTYDFAGAMDFGALGTRRITPTIHALAFDTGDMIDSRGQVDAWDSVDGAVINDATARLFAATSADGSSYGDWFPLPAGDVTCRAIKYRLALASAQPTHNIGIFQLSVTANW